MQASLQEGEVQSPTAKKQPKAKVKGRQLVGSQEIGSDSGASSGGGSGTGEEDKKDNEDESGEEGEGGDEEKSGAEEAEEEGDEVESGSVNSARERARASGMTIDTGKSPEEEKVTGDQKVIEVESGPLYDQKVAVNERIFLARVAEQGGSDDDMVEYVIDLFRKKDKQKVKIEGNPKP